MVCYWLLFRSSNPFLFFSGSDMLLDDIQIAQKKSTTGYLSQNDPRVHFGLNGRDTIDEIEIRWPSGKLQLLENVKADQILQIEEPE